MSAPVRLTALSHGGGCGCKVAPGVLAEILRRSGSLPVPPELLVDGSTADDAAVYRLNAEQALVATTDFFLPIVDDPHDFGRIAATNAISDVYAMGGRPILALALVGMPLQQLGADVVGRILEGGAEACRRAGIPIGGGHTIESVEPLYGLVALGLVHPERIRRNSEARPGDRLILGKGLGVGVLAAALKRDQLDSAGYAALLASTTTLNTAGPELAELAGVHALTDVTGFGLVGHGLEMARGSGCSLRLHWPSVPLLPQARDLAAAGCITGASGRNWAACADQVSLPPGFSPVERMRFVIAPQAIRRVLPPLANEFITLIKDTSLAAVIGFDELFRQGQLMVATTYRAFEIYIAVALVYLVMTTSASLLFKRLERRLSLPS